MPVKSLHTWQRAVVSDETGHVYVLVVNTQVLHAAHELPVLNRKIFWKFGDSSEEQGAGQVQRSDNTDATNIHCRHSPLKHVIKRNVGEIIYEKFITEMQCYVSPGDKNRIHIPIRRKKKANITP